MTIDPGRAVSVKGSAVFQAQIAHGLTRLGDLLRGHHEASLRSQKHRVRSLRAIATVAMPWPRRRAIAA
jgi:hypothetical protein